MPPQTPPKPSETFHNVHTAHIQTSVPEYDIRDAIARGDLPARRQNRALRIADSDLTAWVAAFPQVTK